MHKNLLTYQGLERFDLELVLPEIEMDTIKDKYVEILIKHSETLRSISFSCNKVSNDFFEFMCEKLSGVSKIEFINMTHLKSLQEVNWMKYLESAVKIAENR